MKLFEKLINKIKEKKLKKAEIKEQMKYCFRLRLEI